jgi:alpha-galactosidase
MRTAQKYPPMGWNSYDAFNWSITEKEFIENVDFMDRHLKPFGWEYCVLDFLWSHPGCDERPNPNQMDCGQELAMDRYGRLLPAIDRFPSAYDGNGFRKIAERIHGRSLKFGIHIMRGIPRQAVQMRTVVKGTAYTAADIADTSSTCLWLDHMYGIDMSKPGAQEYLDSLFELYASWGVDLIKIDDLSYPYHEAEIEGYRKAIDRCGREIVFSSSPGETPLSEGEHVRTHIDMWRISADFWDRWTDLKDQCARFHEWSLHRTASTWPDGDMMPVGRISKRGHVGCERHSNYSYDEEETLFSMWLIANSPLMLGGNLTELGRPTLERITNPDAMGMNRTVVDPARVLEEDGILVWKADVRGSDAMRYLAVVNLGDDGTKIAEIDLERIGFQGPCQVFDIWAKKDLGTCGTSIRLPVREHGSRLLQVWR